MNLRHALAGCALAAAAAAPLAAQQQGSFELTVNSIMRGPELVGEAPSRVTWTPDGQWVYFRWKPGGEAWNEEPSLYRVRSSGREPEKLTDEEADSLGVLLASGDVSRDRSRRVVSYEGDLYLIRRQPLSIRRLTRTKAVEAEPVFSKDASRVYFVRDDNVFALDLGAGAVRQLTDIRKGPKPKEEEKAEGQRAFLEEQQKELFETIRVREQEEAERKARREAKEKEGLQTVWIGPKERVFALAVDPDGEHAVLTVGNPGEDRSTLVPKWVTESGYVESIQGRPKVGDEEPMARMALVDLSDGTARWLDVGPPGGDETEPPAAGADSAVVDAAAADSSGNATSAAHAPRPRFARISFLGWNDAGTKGLVGAVSYDYKDQWLQVLDAGTGQLTTIAHDHDDAWIGGPCDPWLSSSCAGWIPDADAAWFVSERSGWSHLYRVRAEAGAEPKQLTSGQWEVKDAGIAPDRRHFGMHTSERSAFDQDFYRMGLEGGERTRLTQDPGLHSVTLSPDGDEMADVYSTSNHPPELYLADAKPGAKRERITTSPTAEWSAYPWIAPEIVTVPARDGVKVPARIYRPADVGATPNGAGVIFVHGAGYLHNVHHGWSDYFREYMFNHLLASKGYVVLDMDYRGSAGYGRDWRTAIYRHMGGKDLTDQVDGVKYLVANEGVQDPERVGIYGGSYGGFITLMALFTQPDWFGAGAALRSVTDWAHYNHWYTARILNLPQDDSTAYRQSSPIYFADGLQDPLLIAHGMQDTNVEFQDVVRLVQRLIELKKTGWELAVFPVENHGFVEPTSWMDEYRRILALFQRTVGSPAAARTDPR